VHTHFLAASLLDRWNPYARQCTTRFKDAH